MIPSNIHPSAVVRISLPIVHYMTKLVRTTEVIHQVSTNNTHHERQNYLTPFLKRSHEISEILTKFHSQIPHTILNHCTRTSPKIKPCRNHYTNNWLFTKENEEE